jgi:hypothetical protein
VWNAVPPSGHGCTELFRDKLQFFFRTSQAFPAILDPARQFKLAPGFEGKRVAAVISRGWLVWIVVWK